MNEKVRLKMEYVKLKQLGKEEEALKVLKLIWNFCKEKQIKVEPQSKVLVKTKKSKKEEVKSIKFKNIKDLSKIKGIGKETTKDLCSIYSCLKDLIKDIKDGKKLPVRNDIEVKLKKEFI